MQTVLSKQGQARCFAAALQGFVLGSGYTGFALTDSLIRGQHNSTVPKGMAVATMVAKEALWTGLNTSALVVAYVGGSGIVETLRGGYSGDAWNTVAGTVCASLVFYRGAPVQHLVRNAAAVATITYFAKRIYLGKTPNSKTPSQVAH